jgi:hypothetical protein
MLPQTQSLNYLQLDNVDYSLLKNIPDSPHRHIASRRNILYRLAMHKI